MPESDKHRAWKKIACNCGGLTEYTLPSGKRLDCSNQDDLIKSCGEIELNKYRIPKAIERLDEAKKNGICDNPRLIVNDGDLDYAKKLVKKKEIEVIPTSRLIEETVKCILKKRQSRMQEFGN
jgi:hypothetical protein